MMFLFLDMFLCLCIHVVIAESTSRLVATQRLVDRLQTELSLVQVMKHTEFVLRWIVVFMEAEYPDSLSILWPQMSEKKAVKKVADLEEQLRLAQQRQLHRKGSLIADSIDGLCFSPNVLRLDGNY